MNVIFCNANTLMDVSLIRELKDKGMNFVLITATEEIRHILKRYYGIDAASLDEYRALDTYNHASLAEYNYRDNEYFSILDRYKVVGNITADTKRLFFNNAFDCWNTFLNDQQVELVIFKMTPHLLYDFVIYELCEQKKIKRVIIEKTYWENVVLLQTTFREDDCLQNPDGLGTIEDVTARIQVKKMPYWTESKLANQQRLARKTGNPSGLKGWTKPASALIKTLREYGFYDGQYKTVDEVYRYHMLKRWNVHRRILKLNDVILDEYNRSLTDYEKIRNDRNIVFYLQCQPEKSTSPLGGKYVDQLLAIKDFMSWMPEGYHLIVKEHPSQFTRWQSLDKGRFPGFYQKILDMGCSLISHKTDNLELFASTALTLSITGSTVFEAWVLGYRAAFMGFPWYRIFDIKQAAGKADVEMLLRESETASAYCDKIQVLNSVGFKGYADEFSEAKFLIENDVRPATDQMARAISQYANAK